MATTYLTNTFSTPTNNKIWTYSVWLKNSTDGSGNITSTDSSRAYWYFGGGQLAFEEYNSGFQYRLKSNAKYRDTSGWLHIVLACDTTQVTASNRMKAYVNGEQITSWEFETQPAQDFNTSWNSAVVHWIGREGSTYYSGLMSHINFCDGTQLAPTVFGQTDAATGEWTINTSPSFTLGTNGFTILKDGNTITDQSSNSNNWTLGGGTLTNTEDNPSDVFATMATPTWYDGTIANGGTTVSTNATAYRYQAGSLGVNKGKFYWEVKLSTLAEYMLCGITDQPSTRTGTPYILGSGAYDYSLYYGNGSTGGGNGHMYNNAGTSPGNTPGQFMGGFSSGDIMTFALDCDNDTLKVGTNGNWANGSNATDQTYSNTTAKAITAVGSTSTGFYFPACGDYTGSTSVLQYNFGNGYFGTTAISSAGTNASNIGIFEYDVPTGYTALSTKGLQE